MNRIEEKRRNVRSLTNQSSLPTRKLDFLKEILSRRNDPFSRKKRNSTVHTCVHRLAAVSRQLAEGSRVAGRENRGEETMSARKEKADPAESQR